MATVSNNDIARAIYSYSKENDASTTIQNVIGFLQKRRLINRAPLILSRLEKIINKEEGRVVAHITTAETLEHSQKSELEEFLKKRYNASHISFRETVDKDVIGGIKIEIDNEVIDFSIKNRVQKLQEYLTK